MNIPVAAVTLMTCIILASSVEVERQEGVATYGSRRGVTYHDSSDLETIFEYPEDIDITDISRRGNHEGHRGRRPKHGRSSHSGLRRSHMRKNPRFTRDNMNNSKPRTYPAKNKPKYRQQNTSKRPRPRRPNMGMNRSKSKSATDTQWNNSGGVREQSYGDLLLNHNFNWESEPINEANYFDEYIEYKNMKEFDNIYEDEEFNLRKEKKGSKIRNMKNKNGNKMSFGGGGVKLDFSHEKRQSSRYKKQARVKTKGMENFGDVVYVHPEGLEDYVKKDINNFNPEPISRVIDAGEMYVETPNVNQKIFSTPSSSKRKRQNKRRRPQVILENTDDASSKSQYVNLADPESVAKLRDLLADIPEPESEKSPTGFPKREHRPNPAAIPQPVVSVQPEVVESDAKKFGIEFRTPSPLSRSPDVFQPTKHPNSGKPVSVKKIDPLRIPQDSRTRDRPSPFESPRIQSIISSNQHSNPSSRTSTRERELIVQSLNLEKRNELARRKRMQNILARYVRQKRRAQILNKLTSKMRNPIYREDSLRHLGPATVRRMNNGPAGQVVQKKIILRGLV